jgi:PAS domain S-box-containing protein
MPTPSLSLAAIRQPAFLYNADGRIVEANDLAEALAGRSLAGSTLAAVVGIFDVRSQGGTPLMAAGLPVSRALAGEEAIDVPLVVTAADGRTLHVLATAAPILNGGEVAGAFSIWQDMSDRERMHAEAETAAEELQVQQEELVQQGDELVRAISDLDRQQQLLDGILGAMPHHVSLWDRNERLVWANERFAAALGEPREALVGRTWRELWPEAPGIAPLVEGALRSVGAGTPFTCELEAAGPAGQGWRAVTFLPIFRDQVLVITEEITERKRVEEALQEYTKRLRASEKNAQDRLQELEAVYDAAPVGLCILDTDLRFVRLNRRFAEINGVPVEAHIGRTPREVVPDLGEQAEAAMRHVIETGEMLDLEVSGTTPARPGVVRYWKERWVPLRDRAGGITGISIAAIEVTEQRRAEHALRESEEKSRTLADLSPDAIVVHTGGVIRYANPAAVRLLRAGAATDLIGTSILDLVHPEDRATATGRVEHVERRGAVTPLWEFRFLVGGDVIDAEAAGGPVLWEGAPAVQVIIRDITDRKRVEAALRSALATAQEGSRS